MTLHEYLDALKGKRAAVIGIGVSNQPLLNLLLEAGIDVTACDKKDRAALGALGDELEKMGLGVPQLTRVFHRLKAMGVDIDPSVYTLDQAKAAILDKLRKGAV